jgi:hypothetical protein
MLVGVAIVPWVVFDRVLVPLKGETVSLRTEKVGWLAGFDQYNNNTTASYIGGRSQHELSANLVPLQPSVRHWRNGLIQRPNHLSPQQCDLDFGEVQVPLC